MRVSGSDLHGEVRSVSLARCLLSNDAGSSFFGAFATLPPISGEGTDQKQLEARRALAARRSTGKGAPQLVASRITARPCSCCAYAG